jgi:hypothetical protein
MKNGLKMANQKKEICYKNNILYGGDDNSKQILL